MLSPLYACEFCGLEINPKAPNTWTLVTGWIQPRKPAAPKYPSAPHGFACDMCMQERKYGTPPPTLFV